MDRYSGGVELPKHVTETITAPTTNPAGQFTYAAKYKPEAIGKILVEMQYTGGTRSYFVRPISLAGNVITFGAYRFTYYLTLSADNANSGGAGADPHTHALNYTLLSVGLTDVANTTLPDHILHYEVG